MAIDEKLELEGGIIKIITDHNVRVRALVIISVQARKFILRTTLPLQNQKMLFDFERRNGAVNERFEFTRKRIKATVLTKYRTLKECLDLAKAISEMPMGSVIVMHEEALRGNVYRYGNHGAIWEHIGTLNGFA